MTRAERFSIYHNAYRARLRATLRSDHPVVAQAAGDAFDSLADAYTQHHPSSYESLRWFGNDFPQFLSTLTQPDALAWSAMARFERAMLDAFDAPTDAQLELAALGELAQAGHVVKKIGLHRSVRVLSPGWNVVPQWHNTKRGTALGPWLEDDSIWVLWRSRDRRTSFRSVSAVESQLLGAARQGSSLPEMCQKLSTQLDHEKVPHVVAATLKTWLEGGLVAALA